MTNSRQKGKRGELEFSAALREFGFEARRGQQFCGGEDSPDVVTSLTDVSFEVKRVEALNVDKAMDQAITDAKELIPVVAHRRNRKPWLITVRLEDLKRFASHVEKVSDEPKL